MRRIALGIAIPLLLIGLLFSVASSIRRATAPVKVSPVARVPAPGLTAAPAVSTAAPAAPTVAAALDMPPANVKMPAAAAPTNTTAAASGGAVAAMSGGGADTYMPPPAAARRAPAAGGTGGSTNAADGVSPPAEAPPVHYSGVAPGTYQSPLTAGQVDDNAKFAEYLDYLHRYQGPPVHPVAVDRRLFVRVLDASQQPVAGARVQLFAGPRPVFDGRTVSDGRVLFFPAAAGAVQTAQFRALVSRGQQQIETTIPAGAPETSVSLPKLTDNSGPVSLDLVFLLDSTGSMGDEIATVKATVDSIAARIEQLPGSSRPRFGLVTFRDRGDEYVTRAWDFTGDVSEFSTNLAQVEAGGGGDNPESVNAGLHDAIHLPGWASADSGRHLRMIVLVGDAPPHLDYANDYEYTALLREAVAAGIKIFPVGASGLDDQGEYIFRQFAEQTQGQFVFVTYANGVSGAPGTGTTLHVEDYTVHNLDGVVVQLVAGEIANQVGRGQTGAVPPDPAPGVIDVVAPGPPALPATEDPSLPAVLGRWAGALVGDGSFPLWALALILAVGWAMRAPGRARRSAAPIAFAGGPPGAAHSMAAPQAARVLLDRTTRLSAAVAPAAPDPVDVYVSAPPAGHPTTPLPRRE